MGKLVRDVGGRAGNKICNLFPAFPHAFFVFSANLRTVNLYGEGITKEASVIQVLYQDFTRDKIFNNCIFFLPVC